MELTFLPQVSLVLLSSGDNVSEGAFQFTDHIVSLDIIHMFGIIDVKHRKLQLLDFLEVVVQ